MSKFTVGFALISILFTAEIAFSDDKQDKMKENEHKTLKQTLSDAKKRIKDAGTYTWNDALRFLPTVTLSRRAPYDEYSKTTNETYFSASISFNQFFDLADIHNKKAVEKRKALRKVENLAFNIEKLIDRKYLLTDQIGKMKKIVKSIDDPLEAANKQEKIDALEVKKNETVIEIERLYAEIEYTCVEVEK